MIQIFSPQWFKRYQRALLLYANTLGRDRLQIETNRRIIGIQPHSVTWQEDKHGLKSTAFYPRSPFADALKMDLWPFWKTLHSLDMSFLARKLSLNFGFDTLTKYPDPHTETDTVDGYVLRYVAAGDTFANMRGGVGVGANDTATNTNDDARLVSHATTSDNYTYLYRGIILFNTSALTTGANISAATYGFVCVSKGTALGDTNFCLVTSDPASNTAIAASDYQRTFGTTDLFETPFAISAITGPGRMTKNVSATGLGLISKDGITKFGHRTGWDLSGTGPTWSGDKITTVTLYHADYGTPASYAPQLIVTYTTSVPCTVSPDATPAIYDLLAAAIAGKSIVSPAAVATAGEIQAPIVQVPIIVSPATIALTAAIQAPTVYAGTAYYVSVADGDDAHDGKSTANPWLTIAKVNSVSFVPNDQILFKRGETWNEMLTPLTSGTAGSPIVFGNYSAGALPIIDCGGVRNQSVGYDGAWNKSYLTFRELDCWNGAYGLYFNTVDHIVIQDCIVTNEYYHGIEIENSQYILVENCNVSDCGSTGICFDHNILHSRVHNNVVHDCIGSGIRLGDDNTNNLGCDYNEIDGNECYANAWGGIYIIFADHNLIHDNHSHDNLFGVGETGEPYGIGVQSCAYNEFYDNELNDNDWDGIQLWSYGSFHSTIIWVDASGEGTNLWYDASVTHDPVVVLFNGVSGNKQTSKGAVDSALDWWWDSSNAKVYVYSASDPATVPVKVGRECDENKIHRNRIYGNGRNGIVIDGGFPAYPQLVNNEVYYNLVYDNEESGIYLSTRVDSTGNKCYNNTVVGNIGTSQPAYCGICVSYGNGWDVKNNIVADNTRGELYGGGPCAITHDHNLYHRGSGDSVTYNSIGYTPAEVLSEHFEDTAVVIDPLFVDEANHDYHLQSGSPAINAGTDVSLTIDYDGNAISGNPDMGAYEYVGLMAVYPSIVSLTGTPLATTTSGKALVSPSAIAMTLAIPAPVVNVQKIVYPAAVVLAANIPVTTTTGGARAPPATISLAGATPVPVISGKSSIIPNTLSGTLAINAPVASGKSNVIPAVIGLAGTVQTAIVSIPANVQPSAVNLAGAVQAVTITGKANVSPTAIGLAGAIPAVTILSGKIVYPDAIGLIIAILASVISGKAVVSPSALSGSLAIPAVTISGKAIVSPATVELTGAIQAPVITGLGNVTPSIITLTGVTPAPTVAGKAIVSPNALAEILAILAITFQSAMTISVSAIGLTGAIPVVTVTGSANVMPSAIALTGAIPAVAVGGKAIVSASALTLAIAIPSPAITGKALVSVAAVATILTRPIPAILVIAVPRIAFFNWLEFNRYAFNDLGYYAVTVSPVAIGIVGAIPAVAVTGGSSVLPAAVSLAISIPVVAATGESNVVPSAVILTGAIPTPPVTGLGNVAPSVVTLIGAIPTPQINIQVIVQQTTMMLAGAVKLPAVTGAAIVIPSPVGMTADIPIPTVEGNSAVTPATIELSATIPAVEIVVIVLIAAPIVGDLTIPTCTIFGGELISPSAFALTLAVPAPDFLIDANEYPATVGGILAIPAITFRTPASVSIATIGMTDAVPDVVVTGAAIVSSAVAGLAVTVPAAVATGDTAVFPSAIEMMAGIPLSIGHGAAIVSPGTVPLVLSVLIPVASGSAIIYPSAITSAGGIPAPSISGKANVLPAALILTLTVMAPSVTGKGMATPAAINMVSGFPIPFAGWIPTFQINWDAFIDQTVSLIGAIDQIVSLTGAIDKTIRRTAVLKGDT